MAVPLREITAAQVPCGGPGAGWEGGKLAAGSYSPLEHKVLGRKQPGTGSGRRVGTGRGGTWGCRSWGAPGGCGQGTSTGADHRLAVEESPLSPEAASAAFVTYPSNWAVSRSQARFLHRSQSAKQISPVN